MNQREHGVAWVLFALLVMAAVGSLILVDAAPTTPGSPLVAGNGSSDEAATDDGTDGEATDDGTDGEATDDTALADTTSFTIAATGDLLIHESVAASAATADGYDFGAQLALVAPLLSGADLAICHLEVPLSADNADLAYYPAFRVPYQVADAIAGVGYDTCSVASNHALDAGASGVASTIEHLDRVGVAHAGTATTAAADDALTLVDAGPATVGHLSYAYGLNGFDALPADGPFLVDLIDEAAILAEAARLREAGADFVVASLHWGTEYEAEVSETQSGLAQRLLASDDIDLIVGHHAHVLQQVRRFGDEYALFGLGNFLSNQSTETCSTCPVGTQDGAIVELTVNRADDGRWVVDALDYVSTWVRLDGHVVVPTDADPVPTGVDPAVLAASADRTSAALGPEIRPRPDNSSDANE